MPDKGWKAYERRIAKRFGTRRNPLSGGMSGHTRSDTLHKGLFIEMKNRRGFVPALNSFKEYEEMAAKEKKVPALIFKAPRVEDNDSLVLCRLKDLKVIADEHV